MARLETARRELLLAPTYDFTVVNDDADRAAAELAEILENWANDPDEFPEE